MIFFSLFELFRVRSSFYQERPVSFSWRSGPQFLEQMDLLILFN